LTRTETFPGTDLIDWKLVFHGTVKTYKIEVGVLYMRLFQISWDMFLQRIGKIG